MSGECLYGDDYDADPGGEERDPLLGGQPEYVVCRFVSGSPPEWVAGTMEGWHRRVDLVPPAPVEPWLQSGQLGNLLSARVVKPGRFERREDGAVTTGLKYRRVTDDLRYQIVTGRIRYRLPSLPVLAAQYEVSVPIVVQAIAVLRYEGYVVSRAGSGAFPAIPPESEVWAAWTAWRADRSRANRLALIGALRAVED